MMQSLYVAARKQEEFRIRFERLSDTHANALRLMQRLNTYIEDYADITSNYGVPVGTPTEIKSRSRRQQVHWDDMKKELADIELALKEAENDKPMIEEERKKAVEALVKFR